VLLLTVTECVNAVANWMQSNRMQLNNDKTEFLWCSSSTSFTDLRSNYWLIHCDAIVNGS